MYEITNIVFSSGMQMGYVVSFSAFMFGIFINAIGEVVGFIDKMISSKIASKHAVKVD